MNKIILTKTTSAIFLAIVLVTGTITLMHPSFMAGAQAQPYYGQDNNYDKKSDAKNVSVKSIKCNNVNVNVNGLELDGLPPSLGGLLNGGEGDEGQYGANSYGSNGYGGQQSGYDNKNSFKFVCINNNNNTVIEAEEPIPPVQPTLPVENCAEDVEACFEEFLRPGDFEILTMALENGFNLIIGEEQVTLNSFADICEELEGLTEFELLGAMGDILGTLGIIPPEDFAGLVDCIAEAIGIPRPPA